MSFSAEINEYTSTLDKVLAVNIYRHIQCFVGSCVFSRRNLNCDVAKDRIAAAALKVEFD